MTRWDVVKPRAWFAEADWPDGPPRPGAPDQALYAAEIANFVRRHAYMRGDNLAAGVKVLAAEVGMSADSLRQIADGRRWVGLALVANLEVALQEPATGYLLVAARRLRGGTAARSSGHPHQVQSELAAMRKQIAALTAERDDALSALHDAGGTLPGRHAGREIGTPPSSGDTRR